MKKLLGTLALLFSVGLPVSANAALQQLTNLFVFGDSLSDGGNSGLASLAATGGQVVIPPPPYYNGQYSNGPVAVEYLWQAYNPGNTSFKPSLVGGTNYAIGGATSGLENYNSINPKIPPPLQPIYNQLGNAWQLQTFAAQHPVFDPATSLFVVWLFPNDVFYWTRTLQNTGVPMLPGTASGGPAVPGDIGALISNGVTNIVNTVIALAGAGAQHFLVPNMPDLGALPDSIGTPEAGFLTFLTDVFNFNLAQALTGLDNALLSAEIVQFDTHALFRSVLANPSAYGFDVADKACVDNFGFGPGQCNPGNVNKWVFWDGVHPTTQADRIIGAQFAAAVPEPVSVVLVILGLVGMNVSRKRKLA